MSAVDIEGAPADRGATKATPSIESLRARLHTAAETLLPDDVRVLAAIVQELPSAKLRRVLEDAVREGVQERGGARIEAPSSQRLTALSGLWRVWRDIARMVGVTIAPPRGVDEHLTLHARGSEQP